MAIPTLEDIIQLSKDGTIDEEGARALVAEHYPYLDGHFKIPEHITVTTGARSDAPPSIDSLTALNAKGLLSDEGLRAAMTEHYPDIALARPKVVGEDGKITEQGQTALEGLRSAMVEYVKHYDTEGLRHLVVTVDHDGSVSTDAGAPTTAGGTVTDDGAEEQTTLIQGIDACLDHAAAAIGDTDLTTLPDNIQQAISLLYAAGVAVDELQNVLGIDDPDDPLETEGGRAALTTAEENDLPDTSFGYVEPGGAKDGSGKTVPRGKRHYPLEKTPGKLDPDHVRNAISRIGTELKGDDEDAKDLAKKATPAVKAAAKKLEIDAPSLDEGTRSTDELAEGLRERFDVTE